MAFRYSVQYIIIAQSTVETRDKRLWGDRTYPGHFFKISYSAVLSQITIWLTPHYIEAPDKIFYWSEPILDLLKLYRKWYSTGRRLSFIASDLVWRQNSVSHLLIVILWALVPSAPQIFRPSVCPSICPSVCLAIHLSVRFSVCPSVHLSKST